MRIYISTQNFAPERTSTGKYTGELAAWLANRGNDVTVITGFPFYPEWKLSAPYKKTSYRTEQVDGVTVRRAPHYLSRRGKVTSARRMLIELTLCLATLPYWLALLRPSRRPDVIVSVCPPLASSVWPWMFSKLAGIPWVLHIQDFQVDAAVRLGMIKMGLLGRVMYWLENRMLRSATRVSSISPAMCRLAESKGASPDRVLLTPNWGDITGIVPVARDTALRRRLGVTPDQILLMYAGAMGRKQGLELVLDAAGQLKKDLRYHFVMIGSGSDAEALRREAARRDLRNVTFLPLQETGAMCDVLGSGDIHLVIQKKNAADLVMPSKLTNILAAGRPALVTAEEGTELHSVVKGNVVGMVVPPENAIALLNGIRTLADDDALRMRLGASARSYAVANLSRETILQRFECQLGSLVGAPPQSPETAATPLVVGEPVALDNSPAATAPL